MQDKKNGETTTEEFTDVERMMIDGFELAMLVSSVMGATSKDQLHSSGVYAKEQASVITRDNSGARHRLIGVNVPLPLAAKLADTAIRLRDSDAGKALGDKLLAMKHAEQAQGAAN